MIGPTKTEPTKAAPETLVRDNLALLEVTVCSEGLGLLIITIYGQCSQNRTGSVGLPR
jgi:hypothetical protein